MFLKKIEIQGFKSFAHKTVLNFSPGMTAIVGPNGSGKSNIADAVRWVLGEQKAKALRGSSMQDVIFAGTEFRKPLGFAYVAMTFDNSDGSLAIDYSEVTVSRKLFRSGESEYILNGQVVRLKDVQELFFDTGIGKEGYSIIGQGQVEAIINGKPEDRRGLFDEACGITKFKKRKQIAVKKLEDTKADLIRITDILHELERRIGPLEKQSEGAREYLKLRDELKIFELNMFVRDADRLLGEMDEIQKNITITRGQLDTVKGEDESLKNKNKELSEELAKAEEVLRTSGEEIHKGELLIQNLESQISVSDTEIRSLESEIAILSGNNEKLQAENARRTAAVGDYLRSLIDLRNDLAAFDTRSGSLITENGYAEEEISTSELYKKIEGFESSLKKAFPGAEALPSETSEAAEPDGETDDFEFEEPAWLKAIKNKRNDLTDIHEKEADNRKWIEKSTSEAAQISADLKDLTDKRSAVETQAAGVRSKLETLRNISERYEGYGQSVQNVMALKNRIPGIHGVVADLVTTKKEYEVAIETALGGRIQNIVTESEETAKNIIEILKKNRLGRATFLPLDAVKGKTAEEYRDALKENGCLGIASSLVENDTQYDGVVQNLLGNTLVAKNIDYALTIAGKHRHGLRIVTLEGELLSPGGSIAGGSFRSSTSLMSRSRELGELQEELNRLNAEVRSLAGDISDCEKKLSEKNDELNKLYEKQREINEKKNSISFDIMSDLKTKFASLTQSVDFIAENIERILSENEAYQKDLASVEGSMTQNRNAISEKQKSISDRKEDIEAVRKGIQGAKELLEVSEKKRDELSRSQSEYFTVKDELSEKIVMLEKEVMRLESSMEKGQQKLEQSTGHIWEEYQTGLSEARKYMDKELGPDSRIRQKISELRSAIKDLGPINIQAIDEFKEVSERYELTKTQHDDIMTAQNTVLDIIRELDTEMKKQFSVQFKLIAEEFSKVFAKLFGGGEASLELVFDEEAGENDELTCGIGIIAQPPGKKLQNMMQLSGGEKALTAIALLFAIQNLKPSPFCLLDEIEAALDDSNVIRFARYVKAISDRSQFILITHRRGTMEEADRLYGVTMQEKGVTSLVSVDLVSDSVN